MYILAGKAQTTNEVHIKKNHMKCGDKHIF